MLSSLKLLSMTLSAQIDTSDWIVIGQIVAPQGLAGAVRVYPESDFPARFLEPGPRWLKTHPDGVPIPVTLTEGRFLHRPGLYVLTFAEYQSRTEAENLRGSQLVVPASDRPPLEPNEIHLMDLIGLDVVIPPDPEVIGTVVGLINAGNDLLEIRLHRPQSPMVLVPLVREIVPRIDLEQRRIELTPPTGLIPVK